MKVLLLNQAFYPDAAATAQYAADLAAGLVRSGHEVTVVASSRGYDSPSTRYATEEDWGGIRIVRVDATGFGKGAAWRRAADFGSFWLACIARMLRLERFDLIIAMTTPPLISAAGAALARLRGSDFACWVMDLNPDQAVAAGWMRQGSAAHRVLDRLVTASLRAAGQVIVLDRFMADRVARKGVDFARITVLPPWSRSGCARFDPAGREAFRARHGLNGRFVVMYSGNHSPCHPLDTVLSAALQLRDHREIAFCFVGGGASLPGVREFARVHALTNVLCLPYQPEEQLAASLSAADLHLVVMGEAFRGIVHPCKIYGIFAVSAPCLYIGPQESHIADLAGVTDIRLARHGDPAAVVAHVLDAAARGPRRSERNHQASLQFAQEDLCASLVSLLEAVGTAKPGREGSRAAAAAAGGGGAWNRY